MHPVSDLDAIVVLAVALAAKRRPAELTEVVAATELIASHIPDAPLLAGAVERLSMHGLVIEQDGGLVLSPEAQQALVGEPKKADAATRIFWVRDQLSTLRGKADHPAAPVTAELFGEAIKAHAEAVKAATTQLMTPKPKPPEDNGRGPGFKKRKPLPARRRRV